MASNRIPTATQNYQVFLSFRGPDTRQGFTDVLYHSLVDAGIHVFRDDEELRIGEEISDDLLRAIEDSRIFVPIFSRTYASSKWCLVELAKMVESKRGSSKKKILPIFYDVGVDDVKLKSELYISALKKHEEKFGPKTVQQWEEALRKVGKFKGWELKNKGHGEFAKLFVREVSMKLKVKHKCVTQYFIPRDDQMEALMKSLDVESTDVRFVGIHGMGGIGKTTIAKAAYNKLCDLFDCCSFLLDVREFSQRNGIEHLQKQLLNSLGFKSRDIMDVDDGIMIMKERFQNKKVLLILDDVDHKKQIENLAGEASWFGPGSRIIITTRDLRVLEVQQETFQTFEVQQMKFSEALKLFSMHAFERENPSNFYLSLSEQVVKYTGGLPLALEVVGSHLRDKSQEDWVDTIERLEKIPLQEVQEKLMISYEALDYGTKQIFLDIACFFINQVKTYAMYMWQDCEFDPKMGLKLLMYKSLVKIVDHHVFGMPTNTKVLWMHNQLRDLARKIVHDESFKSIARRSRLWLQDDALEVLQGVESRENVEMLRLPCAVPANQCTLTHKDLSGLQNLRYLECFGANFSGDLSCLLPKLRWLCWHFCPPEFKGTNLYLRNLVILDLSRSLISDNWSGWSQIGIGNKLKVLNLTGCINLTKTPDFSNYVSLEKLILEGCSKIVEIDPSVAKLRSLKHLNVKNCLRLRGFPGELFSLDGLEEIVMHGSGNYFDMPESFHKLKSLSTFELAYVRVDKISHSIGSLVRLKHLCLSFCWGLTSLPDSLGDLRRLVKLVVSSTLIVELPQSIGRLVKLENLSVVGCQNIKKLPDSIGGLKSLVELDVSNTGIDELPDTMGNLKRLKVIRMRSCQIRQLPDFIGLLQNLEELIVGGCQVLQGAIPSGIKGLTRLRVLDLAYTNVCQLPPKLPTSLAHLLIASPCLQSVPKLSKLTHLVGLVLSDNTGSNQPRSHPQPFKLHGLSKLSSLVKLELHLLNIAFLPKKLSSLPRLKSLTLRCPNLQHRACLPSSLSTLIIQGIEERTELPHISNLVNLTYLEFQGCQTGDSKLESLEVGELNSLWAFSLDSCGFRKLDGLCLPENLRLLSIQKCEFLEAVPTLSHLKNLTMLNLLMLRNLVEIPGLQKLRSLQNLMIQCCSSLERLEKLSKLKGLRSIEIQFCRKLKDTGDVDRLKSVVQLQIFGCDRENVTFQRLPGETQGESSRKRRFEDLD